MNESLIQTISRAFGAGSSRRSILQGFTGLSLAGGIAHPGLADAAARKRKKKRKGKRKRKKGGKGGGGGSGGDDCQLTICDGQCVALDTDPNNCGACGRACNDEGESCVEGQCVAIFGSQGNGVGQFQNPTGIAVNTEGDVFVTDTGNDRLVFLDGGEVGDADFVQPEGVAVNRISGQIYVTDFGFEAVFRLDDDGTFLNSFGGQDSGEGQLRRPFGVAISPVTGQVFVADTGNSRIQRFNAIGQPLSLFGEAGDGEGQLSFPRGLAINGNDEVIVADTANKRIQVFERRVVENDFIFVRAFGSEGSGDGQFSTPTAVAVDDDDNIYVADLDNHRVQQFTSDGQFVTAFGRRGSAPGEFDGPTAIAIDQTGQIFVVDQGNHRVQRFSPPGTDVKSEKRRASHKGRDGARA